MWPKPFGNRNSGTSLNKLIVKGSDQVCVFICCRYVGKIFETLHFLTNVLLSSDCFVLNWHDEQVH